MGEIGGWRGESAQVKSVLSVELLAGIHHETSCVHASSCVLLVVAHWLLLTATFNLVDAVMCV
jgi:hypothetical protein